MKATFLLLGAVAALAVAAPSSSVITLEGDPPVVQVRSPAIAVATRDWTSVLQVRVDRPDAPPLAGQYSAEAGSLRFTPRYALQPGLTYSASFHLGSEKVTASLIPVDPKASEPAGLVERVYPSTDVWPENQLKFYILFSRAMSRGEAFQRVHLIDLSGSSEKAIPLPFLEIDEELWDRDQKRLTILFDPGRVKRGLVPNQEAGPPLVDAGKYRLVIDRDWKDAANRPLQRGFIKEFAVGPAVREGIDVRQWKLTAPKAGTRDPLRVDFSKPLDAALLFHCLEVEGVKGQVSLEDSERRWTFTPDAAWKPNMSYTLKVYEILEDLAGNKVGRAFDVDRFEKVDKAVAKGSVRIPFTASAR